ncbi:MAG: M23 family metallopeptidase [Acidimicrobiales bacterium]
MSTHQTSARRLTASIVVGLALLVGVVATPASARPQRPAQEGPSDAELKAQHDEIIGQETAMLKRLEAAQRDRQAATDKLQGIQDQTRAKQVELLGAQSRLDQAEARLQRRIAARRAAMARQRLARERLRRQIVASHVAGGDNGSALEAFLTAQSGDEAGKALTYGKAVSGNTQQLVTALQRAEDDVTRTARAANRAKEAARSSRDQIQQAAVFLQSAQQEQQKVVADLNLAYLVEAKALRDIQGRKALVEGRINAMNTASDGIAMILADRQKGQPDWQPGSVTITTPLPGEKVSSPFGERFHPILHITRLHAGCDLGGTIGQEIHAAADGVVVVAEVRGGYGNAVVIDHGNSLATLYGHTSKMLVKAGDVVKRGDVIALLGSTGLSTGPHLHFETRIKGLPIDPEGVIDFDAPVDYGP